jgi:hypothetical protein
MHDVAARSFERTTDPRYPARVLDRPEITPGGVCCEESGAIELLPWYRVLWVIAAEVGEPQGVRTIVFDLLIEAPNGDVHIQRLDAEPGSDALELAREVARGVGKDRLSPSLKCLATDGLPARWYPDLESFEEEAIAELREVSEVLHAPREPL